jgi:hypothetical protein
MSNITGCLIGRFNHPLFHPALPHMLYIHRLGTPFFGTCGTSIEFHV